MLCWHNLLNSAQNTYLPGNSGHLISMHKRKGRVQNSLHIHALAESEKLTLQGDSVPVTQLVKYSASNRKVIGLTPILVKKYTFKKSAYCGNNIL